MKLYRGKPVYNRMLVFFLSLFLGVMGLDRIYLQDYKGGFLKLFTLGGLGIWYFIDLFHLGLGKKLGHSNYWWSCQLEHVQNCQYENDLIFRVLLSFAGLAIFILYFYAPTPENKLILKDEIVEVNK